MTQSLKLMQEQLTQKHHIPDTSFLSRGAWFLTQQSRYTNSYNLSCTFYNTTTTCPAVPADPQVPFSSSNKDSRKCKQYNKTKVLQQLHNQRTEADSQHIWHNKACTYAT
jgi:hypothetical protein